MSSITEVPFEAFTKIPRLSRDIVITEKIDGTNAQIYVNEDASDLLAGSRTRWLSEGADNFGFWRWTQEHKIELLQLGPGRHFGEWWGSGIQRGYGLPAGQKRFSLFNTTRWTDNRPSCCDVVPTLYAGDFDMDQIVNQLELLRKFGSRAAPFMNPEGIVIYHTASGQLFKKTLEHDEKPKGKQSE